MKDGNWVALHKNLCHFLPHGRAYTVLEAMFSYTLDIDNNREQTIRGYSKQWGWSRNKVRKMIGELRATKGHVAGQKGTSEGHRILLKINNLQEVKGQSRATKGPLKGHKRDTTNYPNPKPNPKPKEKKDIYGEFKNVELTKKEYEKLGQKFNGTFNEKIESLSSYIASKGTKYSSHYATILTWARKEDKEKDNYWEDFNNAK